MSIRCLVGRHDYVLDTIQGEFMHTKFNYICQRCHKENQSASIAELWEDPAYIEDMRQKVRKIMEATPKKGK